MARKLTELTGLRAANRSPRELASLVAPEVATVPTPGHGLSLDDRKKADYTLLKDAPTDGDMLRYVVDATSGVGKWTPVAAVQTVSAIGSATAYNGAVALVDIGGPTEGGANWNELMVYNLAEGQWISANYTAFYSGASAAITTGYTDLVVTGDATDWVGYKTMPWRDYDTAGLKPQLRLDFQAQGTAAETATCQILSAGQDNEANASSELTVVEQVVTVLGFTAAGVTHEQFGWNNIGAHTLADAVRWHVQAKGSNAGGQNIQGCTTFCRYVSK